MAENTILKDYNNSGYGASNGTAPMKEELSKLPTTDEALRQQAVDQYADTYKILDESYSRQLSSLIVAQANDEKLLNEQYNNSVSSMMAKLQKRGLHVTAALPEAQTAALNKHRNETMAFRGNIYAVQRSLPEARQKLLHTGYEQAIAQRIAANRAAYIPFATDLLKQISELQYSSYKDFTDYLLMKKARSGGGGGGSRRSGGSSSKSSSSSSGYVKQDDLKGSTTVYYNYNAGWQNRGGSRDSYDSGVRSAYKARK